MSKALWRSPQGGHLRVQPRVKFVVVLLHTSEDLHFPPFDGLNRSRATASPMIPVLLALSLARVSARRAFLRRYYYVGRFRDQTGPPGAHHHHHPTPA
jgi:hypothetical protein